MKKMENRPTSISPSLQLAPLISLVPSNTLVFNLEKGTQPRATLRITNISNNKVIFKVKTTQPSWYYVRPNQQMLDVGQSEEVAILLVDTECNRFLEQSGKNNEEKLEKHRFLVQSKVLEDDEFNRLLAMQANQRGEEFTKIWDGPKDDRKNFKLKVEFRHPGDQSQAASAVSNARVPVTGEAVESRAKPKITDTINSIMQTKASEETSTANTPEAVYTELQSLRKKYDAVVEYTVHLTAERDAIVAQLESSQKELLKEKSKKKGNDTHQSTSKLDKTSNEKGFSLFVLLILGLICFVIGKYFS